MKTKIHYLNWREMIHGQENIYAINDDIVLLEKPIIPEEFYNNPFKEDILVGVVCTKGYIEGKINLQAYKGEAPCLIIVMPDVILEFKHMSEDFEGKFIALSKTFLSNLQIDNILDMRINISNDLYIPLQKEEMDAMMVYYTAMRGAISVEDNPHRLEIARLVTTAFFYGLGYYLHKRQSAGGTKDKNEILQNRFMKLVQENFKLQKNVEFYAEKLNLTPKYMSTVIKRTSGKSAGEWIDERVFIEAQMLLKSSNQTIQQISDELNFPDQSAFGKFFKRHEGVSPRSYRSSNR